MFPHLHAHARVLFFRMFMSCWNDFGCKEQNNLLGASDFAQVLIIAFKNHIKFMRFNSIGKNTFETITLPEIHSISDVVYNPIDHTLILCDSGRKIYEYDIDRRKLSVIVDEDLEAVKGMDIDVVGENLYWLDGGRLTLEVMSLNTRARTKVMTGVHNPIDLVVLPEKRSIFVARMDHEGGIVTKMNMDGGIVTKMNMDGGNMSIVQRLGGREPVALSYDKNLGRILWLDKNDKMYKSIQSFSVDDQDQTNVRVLIRGGPSDIVTYENQLFWIDPLLQDVRTITFGRLESIRLIEFDEDDENDSISSTAFNISRLYGRLAVITRNLSSLDGLREQHECFPTNPNKKGCSHLCLPSGDGNFTGTCYCPEGYLLDVNGLNCSKPSTCRSNQLICNDGSCIDFTDVCDGTSHCKDHEEDEDEINCAPFTTLCERGFYCKGSGVCIPEALRCNNVNDCPGGEDSDERGCNSTTTTKLIGHSMTTTTNVVDTPTTKMPTWMTPPTTMTPILFESESESRKCYETNVLSIIVIAVLLAIIIIMVALYIRSIRMRTPSTSISVLELAKINYNVA